MTRKRALVAAGALASALIGIGVAMAAVGDRWSTVALPDPSYGVGLASDGTRLYYDKGDHLISFDPDDPTGTDTAVLVMNGPTVIAPNALTYDRTRDVLWAVRHNTDEVYAVNKITGAATFAFNAAGRCERCLGPHRDGLAFDAGILTDPLDDAIWWSNNADWDVYKLNLSGGVIESFDVRGPDQMSGTSDDIHESLSVYGSHGIALAGPHLYLGTNGGKTIVKVDKDTKQFAGVFAITDKSVEDMECDAHTYAPVQVMWIREFIDVEGEPPPPFVKSYELEPGACPPAFGGNMVGGGSVSTGGGVSVTHNLTLHCAVDLRPNHLLVRWSGNRFQLETLINAACSDDPAIGQNPAPAGFDTIQAIGTGRYNGVPGASVELTLKDAGEPGQNDTTQLTIRDAINTVVLSVSGNLQSGNHQAHDE